MYSSVCGFLGGFHILATLNSAAMNIHKQVFVWSTIFCSLEYVARSGIAGAYGSSVEFVGDVYFLSMINLNKKLCWNKAYELWGQRNLTESQLFEINFPPTQFMEEQHLGHSCITRKQLCVWCFTVSQTQKNKRNFSQFFFFFLMRLRLYLLCPRLNRSGANKVMLSP